jgi:hypothetical protein
MPIIKTCKVNGSLQVGNLMGICGKSVVGTPGNRGRCGAHGNTKCVHMIKTKTKTK